MKNERHLCLIRKRYFSKLAAMELLINETYVDVVFPISIKEMDEAHAMQNCNSEIKIFPLFFRKIYGRSATLYPPSLIWRLNQTRAGGAGQEIEY